MKQINLLSMVLCSAVAPSVALAQAPSLEQKQTLPTNLLKNQSYSSQEVNVSKLTTVVPGKEYTLEVRGKFNSGTGRGLDVWANDANGMGFRVSLDAKTLNWNNPLNTLSTLIDADHTKTRTLRFSVAGNQVNIYEDGYFVTTRPLEMIKESVTTNIEKENVNSEVIPASDWGTSKPSPQSKGWYLLDGSNKEVTAWPNSRFEKASSNMQPKYADGTKFVGNFFVIRWDGGLKGKNYKYAYAVTGLKANTKYRFSLDAAYWNNDNNTSFIVGVSKDKTLVNSLATKAIATKGKSGKQILVANSMDFTTGSEGTYYIYMTGTEAMFVIANLQLQEVKETVNPMILIGKDYEGEASVEVESVDYDASGAFAPVAQVGEKVNETLADAGTLQKSFVFNSSFNLSGKTNLHMVAEGNPCANTEFNLQDDNAWLYFDYIKPSKVISDYLSSIKINGQQAENGVNCRVSIWDNGAVVIPNGPAYDKKALVAYDGENFTGNSKEFEIETYHNNLGEWDNKIRSFKLKKGYMATLANNANGTGYSRVFIADDADLEISVLPEGMEKFVSFVRVFRWNWPSKKGKANGYGQKDMLNITATYDWSAGGNSDADVEYTPIRQNLGWPSWDEINQKKGVTHVLGCNEPDRPDQANAKADQVIQMWPEMMKSGLRIGSPAPSSVWAWNRNFMNTADSLNYRVDFMVAHIYEKNKNASSLVSSIQGLVDRGGGDRDGKNGLPVIKRPVWITEWNNGANWTDEKWPMEEGEQRDANSNIIYDEDGNAKMVKRPLSKENAEKQRKFFEETLPALDKCGMIERYYEYDWVQDARALVINGELTPAGKVYADHKAALAYRKANAYDHVWRIAPPFPILNIDKDCRNITINWYDHNGETGKKYILERKMDNETEFKAYKEFTLGSDYAAGGTVTFSEPIPCTSSVVYRIKALSYKDTESIYSREKSFTRDAAVSAPVLKGEAISTSINKISWDAVSGAKTYRLERADAENGEYQVIADNLSVTEYEDKELKEHTTYYYRAYSINSAAERPVSSVLAVTTKAYAVPADMTGVRISGGGNSAALRWNFAYDTFYRVSRAVKADGEFKVVADKVDATYYVDENLVNSLTYYYKVQPYNPAGDGKETAILQATPVAGKYMHLSFDENQGDMTYDDWGCYDAKFVDGTSFDVGRNEGHAAKLVKNSKSYIEMPEGVVSRLEDFTIATWIKMPGGKGRVFDFGSKTSTAMFAQANGTGVRWKITCEKGTFDYTAPFTWDATNWHHLVFVKNGTTMTVYFDGEKAGSAENELNVCPKDLGVTTRNWLGRSQWTSDAYCDHVYDDFSIYNCAISAEDVKTLFQDKALVLNPQYARAVNENSWNTICLPYAATPAQDVEVYSIAGISADNTELYLTQESNMQAGVPYIFHSAGDIAVFAENGEAVETPMVGSSNGLKGIFESKAGDVKNDAYILKSGVWYKVDNQERFNLGNNRAYITSLSDITSGTATARSLKIGGNATTGIEHVNQSAQVAGEVYTLQGTKADKNAKGIVIKNGNKQVKK